MYAPGGQPHGAWSRRGPRRKLVAPVSRSGFHRQLRLVDQGGGPAPDARQLVGRLDVRAPAAGPWWSEGRSTRAQHRVWQNHPLAASDRAGRRGGRPDLRIRRRVEVGEDIQSALRCPAADGPAGGRYVDAGWRRRPQRCRRRNPGDDEREATAAVTLRRLESGSRCPVAGDHSRRMAPGPTCLVRRDVTRTANPQVAAVVAGRHPPTVRRVPRRPDLRRPSDALQAPLGEAAGGPAYSVAGADDDTTSASARRQPTVRPMCGPPPGAHRGGLAGRSRLSRSSATRPIRPMYGARCGGREAPCRRLPAPAGGKYRSTRRGPRTRPAAATPSQVAYRRQLADPWRATGWSARRSKGHKGRRT